MKRNIGYAIALLTLISWNVHALTLQQRKDAAEATAQGGSGQSAAPECTAIQPFYWEIGNSAQALDFAAVGGLDFQANTNMSIASASKWIYAAYVAQRYAGALTAYDIMFLTLESGYHSFGGTSCGGGVVDTVGECLDLGDNGSRDSDAIGKFAYNGGHMEAHAANLAGPPSPRPILQTIQLSNDDDGDLTDAINNELGLTAVVSYTQPSLPGGVKTTPGHYAEFLRAIMTGDLQMSTLLGKYRVCTNVNPLICPNSLNTPVPDTESWHYSIGHWVEDDATSPFGDKSYSNSGSWGFYAWIDSSVTWYGIIGRNVDPGHQVDDDTLMGWPSVECGRRIRKAWLTGVPQT